MVRSKLGAALACAVVLFLGGCGTAKDDVASSSPTATPSSTSGARTQVVVHDAGAEPRQTLRLALSEGSTQHATMTMQMDMSMAVNGKAQPTSSVPPIQMGMAVSISRVEDDGDITAQFHYDHLKVLGAGKAATQVEAALEPLARMNGTVRTTARGELIDADFDVPDDLDPTMKSLLDSIEEQLGNIVVPLPTEPVGIGATWTVHTESTIGGIKAGIDYDYELVGREGDRWVLRVGYAQTVQEQDADLPNMPAGATTHVSASTINGSGRTVVDFGALFPVESSMEARGPVRMRVTQGGGHADLVQRMHLVMKMSD